MTFFVNVYKKMSMVKKAKCLIYIDKKNIFYWHRSCNIYNYEGNKKNKPGKKELKMLKAIFVITVIVIAVALSIPEMIEHNTFSILSDLANK